MSIVVKPDVRVPWSNALIVTHVNVADKNSLASVSHRFTLPLPCLNETGKDMINPNKFVYLWRRHYTMNNYAVFFRLARLLTFFPVSAAEPLGLAATLAFAC